MLRQLRDHLTVTEIRFAPNCFQDSNLRNVSAATPEAHNSLLNNCFEHPCTAGRVDDYNCVGRSG